VQYSGYKGRRAVTIAVGKLGTVVIRPYYKDRWLVLIKKDSWSPQAMAAPNSNINIW
jgi:hypothetical protein